MGLYYNCPVCGSSHITMIATDDTHGYTGYVCGSCHASFGG